MVKYTYSFHFACKSLINESVYEIRTIIELIFDSIVTIFNALIFSVIISYVGNIIETINKRKAEISSNLKIFEKFFEMKEIDDTTRKNIMLYINN